MLTCMKSTVLRARLMVYPLGHTMSLLHGRRGYKFSLRRALGRSKSENIPHRYRRACLSEWPMHRYGTGCMHSSPHSGRVYRPPVIPVIVKTL